MIGGYFTTYNGTPRGRIARINAESFTNLEESLSEEPLASIQWLNNSRIMRIIPKINEKIELHIYNSEGQIIQKQSTTGQVEISLTRLKNGAYCIALYTNQFYQYFKFIKF